MTPSAASMISSMFSTASAHSTLAMTMMPAPPCSSRKPLTARTPAASRRNDAATKSTSWRMPNRRSALSWSVITGSGTDVPGRFTDLRSPSSPEFCTVHTMSIPRTSSTTSPMRPSSTSTDAPGRTARESPGQVWDTSCAVPSTSRSVSTMRSPASSRTGAPPARRPVRISGPRVSSMTAQGEPASRHASRKRSMRAACSSCDPCEKLSRATSIPAASSSRRVRPSSTAGPSVHTIFVLLVMGCMIPRPPRARAAAGPIDEFSHKPSQTPGVRRPPPGTRRPAPQAAPRSFPRQKSARPLSGNGRLNAALHAPGPTPRRPTGRAGCSTRTP